MPKRKSLIIPLHILAWLLYFSLPHLMRPEPRPMDHQGPQMMPHPGSWFWLYFGTLQNLLLIPAFYLNAYYLFPELIRRKRFLLLSFASLGIFALHQLYGNGVAILLLDKGPMHPRLFMGLMNYLVVFSASYGYYSFRHLRLLEVTRQEHELERMQAELQFLRWQISPHFLFNVLNNMVALARKKSDYLEPSLIQLSHLMRYMIYETDEARVSLQREVEYLQSFIRLQSMRYHNVRLDTQIDIPDDAPQRIEPMLLIPFLENAFKHGIDSIGDPVIEMKLSIRGTTLFFSVANRFVPLPAQNKDDASGVGLANVRKRLTFLYGNRHRLETNIDDWYRVSLTIELE